MPARGLGEQPTFDDPVIGPDSLVYADNDLSSHRGRVLRIEENAVAIIDFYDWVAAIPLSDIHTALRENMPGVFLYASTTGKIIQNFGLIKIESEIK